MEINGARSGKQLDLLETATELQRRLTQRGLRLDIEVPGDVDDGEQQVAEFIVDALGVAGVGDFAEFCRRLGFPLLFVLFLCSIRLDVLCRCWSWLWW